MNANFETIQGGVTSAAGFYAAGAHIGLRRKRKDLALVYSVQPCTWAATLTTSSVKAAPVLWNHKLRAKGETVQALVVNSAIANSCTGAAGEQHAQMMAETTAGCFHLHAEQVLVASTGVIGTHLPIKQVIKGIEATAPLISTSTKSANDAAQAITTTDTFLKQFAVKFYIGGKLVTLGAMAKGSGMVHPNMATILSFITTDLAIDQALVQKALTNSVSKTYNMICVDGDRSTNDMVILLANGMAGNKLIAEENEDFATFVEALSWLNEQISKSIASDGEGASKLLEVYVSGAETVEDAQKLALHVVKSSLVKVAFFAEDANWGRIVAAMGAAGVEFDFDKLALSISSGEVVLPLLVDGMPYWIDETNHKEVLSHSELKISICIGEGQYSATAWGCDLTHAYIDKGGNYRRFQQMEKAFPSTFAQGGAA
ncbi:MAG TPA: bifunctional glutamate N-acetyltransferase/amino-acid acetyltransferase ArgJ [Planktothrix sp.]|jgi:glutamate N-acetyltransferase/amino-acid N-acetyltransferase